MDSSPFSVLLFCILAVTLAGCASVPALDPGTADTTLPAVTPPAETSTTPEATASPPPVTILTAPPTPSPLPVAIVAPTCPAGVYPSIDAPSAGGIAGIRPTCQFPFGPYGNITLSAPVAMDVYRGAARADKSAYLDGTFPEPTWVPCYYRSFIEDARQEDFYNGLIAEFRRIRAENALDNDEYLELITAFVQSIPYQTEESAPKFPVETYTDYRGDCDDKALLLAALLSREGYNTSLLYFAAEKHMGVGVADQANPFRSSGYVYIETTGTFLIGMVPERIQGGKELRSDPLIIPVGNGRGYGSGAQVTAILSAYVHARDRIIGRLPQFSGDRDQLHAAIANGTIIPRYESVYGRDAGFAAFQEDVQVYHTIASHLDDRSGIWHWLDSR